MLRTPRLLLRPFRADDGPAVQRLAGAREVADTTLNVPHPYPDGAAEAWIGAQPVAWEEGRAVALAICEAAPGEDDGPLVGAIGLHLVPEHAQAELGYWIAVDRWNRGYATEAGRAMLGLAFDTLRLHRVQARHFTRNAASGRVMQKLGMRFEGVQRGALRRWGVFEDVAVYAILADEWRG
jgi:RimJ/RimL family protein N-acetyltransferase